MNPPTSPQSRSRRRWILRLSVRGTMFGVLVVGAGLGWVGDKARRQRAATAAVRAAKGYVAYDWQYRDGRFRRKTGPSAPAWLRRLVGDEPFQAVTHVNLMDGRPDDAVMAALESQHSLEMLDLDQPRLTEAGFASLGRMTGLRDLTLNGPNVGDSAMIHVGRLFRLERLHLGDTRVGDAGLVHLKGLGRLELLRLDNTPTTDAGMGTLAELRTLRVLGVPGTKVGDAGLARLKTLPLVEIMFYGCPVTASGASSLAKALPPATEVLGP